MRRLRLKPEYFPLVESGRKRSTIRAGAKPDFIGEAELIAGPHAVPIEITRVEIKRYDELGDEDARRDGFDSLAELATALQGLYPGMQGGDPVSIVHFEPAPAPSDSG